MPFEDQHHNPENTSGTGAGNESEKTDGLLMDYQQLAEMKGVPGTGVHEGPHIALNGGQSRDDDRGLDISQYAGPESATSNQLKDPEAPYGTGPGNGLNDTPQENEG